MANHQLVRGAGGPALDLAGGDRAHRLAVSLHALAVEWRQQQPALAEVRLLVEDEDRVVAEDRAQDRLPSPAWKMRDRR